MNSVTTNIQEKEKELIKLATQLLKDRLKSINSNNGLLSLSDVSDLDDFRNKALEDALDLYNKELIRNIIRQSESAKGTALLTVLDVDRINNPATNPFMNEDYGSSKFDIQDGILSFDDIMYKNERRARELSGFALLGQSLVKMAGNAGTTFIDGVAGSAVGLINGIMNENDKGFLYNFVNNPLSVKLNDFNEWLDKAMPTYLTEEYIQNEQNGEWWRNLKTAAWWGDLVKSLGFMIGMAGSASISSGGIAKLLGTLNLRQVVKGALREVDDPKLLRTALNKARSLDDVGDILKKNAKQLKYDNLINTTLSGMLSAAGEGRLESIQSVKLFSDDLYNKLGEYKNNALANLEQLFFTEENMLKGYFVMVQDGNGGYKPLLTEEGAKVYNLLQKEIYDNYNNGLTRAANDITTMSNSIFAQNLVILSVSNILAISKMIGSGFKYQSNVYGLIRKETNKELELRLGKEAAKDIIDREAKNEFGSKMARKFVAKGNKKDLVRGIMSPIREGLEESFQYVASEGEQYRAKSDMNEFSSSYLGYKMFLDANDHQVGSLNSFAIGLQKAFASGLGWELFVSGAIVGALPIPFINVKFHKVVDETTKAKKLDWDITNEMWRSFSDYKKSKNRALTVVDELNNSVENKKILQSIGYLSAHELLEADKVRAIADKDKFAEINSETRQIINLINLYDHAGHINELRDIIYDYSRLKDLPPDEKEKAYDDILSNTINVNTGKSPYEGKSVDEVINKISSKNAKILNKFDDYVETIESILGLYGSVVNSDLKDDFVEELAYYTANILDFEERYEEIIDDTKNLIGRNFSLISKDEIRNILSLSKGKKYPKDLYTDELIATIFFSDMDPKLMLFTLSNYEVILAINNDLKLIKDLEEEGVYVKGASEEFKRNWTDLARIVKARQEYIQKFNELASNPRLFTKEFNDLVDKRREEGIKKYKDAVISRLKEFSDNDDSVNFFEQLDSIPENYKKEIIDEIKKNNTTKYLSKYLFAQKIKEKMDNICNSTAINPEVSTFIKKVITKNIVDIIKESEELFYDKNNVINYLNTWRNKLVELFGNYFSKEYIEVLDNIIDLISTMNFSQKKDKDLDNEEESEEKEITTKEVFKEKEVTDFKTALDILDDLLLKDYEYSSLTTFLLELIDNNCNIEELKNLSNNEKKSLIKHIDTLKTLINEYKVKPTGDELNDVLKANKLIDDSRVNKEINESSRPRNAGSYNITKYNFLTMQEDKALEVYKANVSSDANEELRKIHEILYSKETLDFITTGGLSEIGSEPIYLLIDDIKKITKDSSSSRYETTSDKQVFFAIKNDSGLIVINGSRYLIIGQVGPYVGKNVGDEKINQANLISNTVNKEFNDKKYEHINKENWALSKNRVYIDNIYTGRTVKYDESHKEVKTPKGEEVPTFRGIDEILDYNLWCNKNNENIYFGVKRGLLVVGIPSDIQSKFVLLNASQHEDGTVYMYIKAADGYYYPWRCERRILSAEKTAAQYLNVNREESKLDPVYKLIYDLLSIIIDDENNPSSIEDKGRARAMLQSLLYLGKSKEGEPYRISFSIDKTNSKLITNGIYIGSNRNVISGYTTKSDKINKVMRVLGEKNAIVLIKASKLTDPDYRKEIIKNKMVLTDLLYLRKFESSFTIKRMKSVGDYTLEMTGDDTDPSGARPGGFYTKYVTIDGRIYEIGTDGLVDKNVSKRTEAIYYSMKKVEARGGTPTFKLINTIRIGEKELDKGFFLDECRYTDNNEEKKIYVVYNSNKKPIDFVINGTQENDEFLKNLITLVSNDDGETVVFNESVTLKAIDLIDKYGEENWDFATVIYAIAVSKTLSVDKKEFIIAHPDEIVVNPLNELEDIETTVDSFKKQMFTMKGSNKESNEALSSAIISVVDRIKNNKDFLDGDKFKISKLKEELEKSLQKPLKKKEEKRAELMKKDCTKAGSSNSGNISNKSSTTTATSLFSRNGGVSGGPVHGGRPIRTFGRD